VILGDRTGEAVSGIYEKVWREAAAERPAFVLSVGDTIQGLNDRTAEAEWRDAERIFAPLPLYLTPGNHDIWSAASERLFRRHAGHPPHYSFDYEQAHFTILDNSRTEQFSAQELAFLEKDLQNPQPVKFIVSHRPSWLIDAMLLNPRFPLHQLAKKYGVKYVIAGHLHQIVHVELDGVTYLSMPSSGGHLRGSEKYEDGWFFGYALVEVNGQKVQFQIKELGGRVTSLANWGRAGLGRSILPATDPEPAVPGGPKN
jgi:predicted phosphodiesterase